MNLKKDNICTSSLSPDIKKVGYIKEYITTISKNGRTRKKAIIYSYRDVQYDPFGWADSSKYLPGDLDLVSMKLKRDKIIPGWINGSQWHGLRLLADDKVIFWKKENEDEEREETEDEEGNI